MKELGKPTLDICIVEDEQVIRRSLDTYFNSMDGYKVLAAFESVEDFLDTKRALSPSVILLDINLPGMSGINGISPIRSLHENAEIIILTTFQDDENIFKALKNGATSYITKKSPIWEIKAAVDVVSKGGSYMSPDIARRVVASFSHPMKASKIEELTHRQMEVLEAIGEGLSYKLIAQKMGISEHTTNDHIKSIYKKLHINSKGEAIAALHRHRS